MELNNQSKTTAELMLLQEKRAFAKIKNKLLHVKVRKEIYFLVGGLGGKENILFMVSVREPRERVRFALKLKERRKSET